MPYESKPMKKQWIEVEGKMTPIILPQIWSHEKQDWVVTSEQNPLPTQVTGSNVEQFTFFERDIRTETTGYSGFQAPKNATGLVVVTRVHSVTGDVSNGGVSFNVNGRFLTNTLIIGTEKHTRPGLDYITFGYGGGLGDAKGYYDSIRFYRTDIKILPGTTYRCMVDIEGVFDVGEGVDCEVIGFWIKG